MKYLLIDKLNRTLKRRTKNSLSPASGILRVSIFTAVTPTEFLVVLCSLRINVKCFFITPMKAEFWQLFFFTRSIIIDRVMLYVTCGPRVASNVAQHATRQKNDFQIIIDILSLRLGSFAKAHVFKTFHGVYLLYNCTRSHEMQLTAQFQVQIGTN